MRRLVMGVHDRWREQFARAAWRDREKARLLHEQQIRELHERKEEVRADDAEMADLVFGALASPADVATFRMRLDRYDEATVAALMKNEEEMADVERLLNDMRERAFVLPDGRRVFKTRDGLRVFDEHGTQVADEQVSPDQISDDRPTWEAFSSEVQRRERLVNQRADILRFQEQVDVARERLDDKDLTKRELDDIGADLERNMPAAVRRQLPGQAQRPDPELRGQFEAVAGHTPALAVSPVRSFDQFAP